MRIFLTIVYTLLKKNTYIKKNESVCMCVTKTIDINKLIIEFIYPVTLLMNPTFIILYYIFFTITPDR